MLRTATMTLRLKSKQATPTTGIKGDATNGIQRKYPTMPRRDERLDDRKSHRSEEDEMSTIEFVRVTLHIEFNLKQKFACVVWMI
jgi:hypothetical protein